MKQPLFLLLLSAVAVCLSPLVIAQPAEQSLVIPDYFDPSPDNYGKSFSPKLILPGFLGRDPLGLDPGFPIYFDAINGQLPLELNRSDKFRAEGLKVFQPQLATDVFVFSSNLADNKVYYEPNPSIDLTIISEQFRVVTLTVNGKPLEFATNLVVEISAVVDLVKGENEILIAGELQNQAVFSKSYRVFLDDLPPEERQWRILTSFRLGYDSNAVKAFHESMATEKLTNIYSEEESDYNSRLGLTYFYNINNDLDWYLGSYFFRYQKEENEVRDYDLLYAALNWRRQALYLTSSLSRLRTEIDEVSNLLSLELNYDFNFEPGPHSGFLVGSALSAVELPEDRRGALTNLYLRYVGYYLVDWISITNLEFLVGSEDYGSRGTRFDYQKLSSKFTWNKTFWDFNTGLDLMIKDYPDQNSLELDNFDDNKRRDFVFLWSNQYIYYPFSKLSLFAELVYRAQFSNHSPYRKLVLYLGADYLY